MPLTRKPTKPVSKEPSEKDIRSVISRGGSVSQSGETTPLPSAEVRVTVRLAAEMLAQIDSVLSGRKLKMPRNTWLCEAILEKLERDSK